MGDGWVTVGGERIRAVGCSSELGNGRPSGWQRMARKATAGTALDHGGGGEGDDRGRQGSR